MGRIIRPTTVDFETLGITPRPDYPPVPVSVSIKKYKKKPKFYAWGHITGGNNCSWMEAKQALEEVWNSDDPVLFQNAKFDLAVAEEGFDLPPIPWQRLHDTLLLLFLHDPRQTELSLKPAAERLLGQEPEEQDAVADWLIANQPVPGRKIGRAKGANYFGAFIAYCPGNIVGPYANGDVNRTEDLFTLLWPLIMADSRARAYERERRLIPILMDMESQGVPVAHKRLRNDVDKYLGVRDRLTDWIRKQLKVSADFNVDSDRQLLDALISANKVDESRLLLTEKGNLSASKESLAGAMSDHRIAAALAYRAELNTSLNTFMLNWLNTADLSKGLIWTNWNQVRQPNERGKGTVGARTGRLSSTPNFQNIPNPFLAHFQHLLARALFKTVKDYLAAKRLLPRAPFELPPLPNVRSYIEPFPGDVLIDRDYSQQELRLLGHYEEGPLLEAYLENVWLDVHNWAKDMINEMLSSNYTRKPIKDIGFGLIYGMGLGLLAQKIGADVDTAKTLKNAYLTVAPGLRQMYRDMKAIARDGDYMTTWGGRQYMCEEPMIIGGRWREFDYKMVNFLIQGSAADVTKEAVVRYYDVKPDNHKLLLTVHDEGLSSVPRKEREEGMQLMKETMESIELDIPLLTEGTWSSTNWAEMKDYDKGGVLVI